MLYVFIETSSCAVNVFMTQTKKLNVSREFKFKLQDTKSEQQETHKTKKNNKLPLTFHKENKMCKYT